MQRSEDAAIPKPPTSQKQHLQQCVLLREQMILFAQFVEENMFTCATKQYFAPPISIASKDLHNIPGVMLSEMTKRMKSKYPG